MKSIKLLFRINWWYTLYINFKFLPFKKALIFPIWIFGRLDAQSLKGSIIINGKISPGMIRLGESSVGIFDTKLRSVLNLLGELRFNGVAHVGRGSSLSIGPGAKLILGDKFKVTAKTSIIASGGKSIIIGNHCVFSWDILIMNTDFHKILDIGTKNIINSPADVIIGNHVWIGLGVTILKGSTISDNCVIAAKSVVSGKLLDNHSVFGGTPAKLIKSNIQWEG